MASARCYQSDFCRIKIDFDPWIQLISSIIAEERQICQKNTNSGTKDKGIYEI